MSQHHKECGKSNGPQEKVAQKKPSKKILPPLTKKPFCDCEYCECKECPDILKMMSITVTDTTCKFAKKPKRNYPISETNLLPQRQSLLDVLNSDRDCDCEVVARAVRSNVHMNLGLSEIRHNINHTPSTSITDQTSQSEKSQK